jgi:chromosome segregation ATPase
VIEAVMLVTVGFLAATLLALAAVPALARRADRLARKRAEAAFPLSLAEIAADRDHLRAELALRARSLEQEAARAFAAKAGAMREVGQRDMIIAQRERVIAEREAGIADRDEKLARLGADLEQTRSRLEAETAAHAEAAATLDKRIADLAALEHSLADARAALSGTSADLAARNVELEQERASRDRLQSRLAARDEELAALRAEVDTIRLAMIESRTQQLVLEGKRDELVQRLAVSEGALVAAAQAGQAADLAHAEEVKAMREEMRSRDERLEMLHAEIMTLQGALSEARAERLSGKRGSVLPANDANAALRQEIVRIAERLMTMSPKQEAAE